MKKTLIFIFFLVPFWGASQIVKVFDKTTLAPIAHLEIFDEAKSQFTVSNSKGEADISMFYGLDKINFKHTAYKVSVLSYSQLEALKFSVPMVQNVYSIDEVVISASKFEEKKSDVPQQIEVIKASDLVFMNQQTTADVLQNSGSVLVQKSQAGGGSPIIRGFEANKVLMVIDGVRMNNAIYRGGHLQNSITVDNNVLDRIEVVFGPGSVVYGSDALGGVMHFHTKNPVLADSGTVSNLSAGGFTRFATANNEKTAGVNANIGFKKVAYLGGFTYSDFNDLRQGATRNPFYGDWGKSLYYADRINGVDSMLSNSNPNIQLNSGYKQYDMLHKIFFRQSASIDHSINIQYSGSSDIPRYDRLVLLNTQGKLKHAAWFYGPQERLLTAYTLKLKGDNAFYSNARVIAAYQAIEESRHNRNFGSSNLNHRIENLDIYTLNLDFNKIIAEHEIRYGAEMNHNDVKSTASKENLITSVSSALDTRYPDGGSTMQTMAIYATHSLEISPNLILSDGVRFSSVKLNAQFKDKSFFPFPVDEVSQNNRAFNGNLGLAYMPGLDWRFSVLGSSGFRAPNVDDLGKVFDSKPGNVIVPNPILKPEYTSNAEASISKIIDNKVKIEGIGFYTIYKDAIVTQSAQFNGRDSIVYDGKLSRVQTSVNAQRAYIYGFSANFAAEVTASFSITSSLNYTYGRIKTDSIDSPLDHIPPVFGKTSMQLKLNQFRAEAFVLYNGWKKLKDYNIVGEDNLLNATHLGAPAWYTLNFRTSYQVNKNFQVQIALENILDQNYRVFASGISAPGRNLILSLRGGF